MFRSLFYFAGISLFSCASYGSSIPSVQGKVEGVVETVRYHTENQGILLAQKTSRSGRSKNLIKEKTIRYKKGSKNNKTNIDFDAADITGKTKDPYGSGIRGTNNNKGYNFIWIRKKWHPEMVQSASSLDAGY